MTWTCDLDAPGRAPRAAASTRPSSTGLNPQQREAVEYRGPVAAHRRRAPARARRACSPVASPGSCRAARRGRARSSRSRSRTRPPPRCASACRPSSARATDGMWISTFHSACVRILRREAEVFGMKSGFTIYDSADQRALLKRIIKELDADTLGFTPGGVVEPHLEAQERADRRRRLRPQREPERPARRPASSRSSGSTRGACAGRTRSTSTTSSARRCYLFRAFPEVAALYQRRFRHVLVDEYQDTNHAQYALIRELMRPVDARARAGRHAHGRSTAAGGIPGAILTVVGDSDQSIYAFRGADIRNIVEFERDFPNTKVDPARAELPLDPEHPRRRQRRHRQQLRPQGQEAVHDGRRAARRSSATPATSGHDEAQFVADEIEVLHGAGMAYSDIAVFYRTNAQTRALEEIFIRSAMPVPGPRRHQVLRARRDQGCAGLPHRGRQPRTTTWPCAAS